METKNYKFDKTGQFTRHEVKNLPTSMKLKIYAYLKLSTIISRVMIMSKRERM